ncbi:MAG: hypothetical protein KA821_01160 [Chitinophagaceae bacterium]|nr:hypothetical protein [Chitinophagaceae bacterium]
MAKPIKDTPTLKGKDAKRFLRKIKKTEETKASPQQLATMREHFSALRSISKF